MLKNKTKRQLVLTVMAAIAFAPTAAQAYDFTPEGSANWIGIARNLTLAIDSGNERTRACDGINAFAAMRADFRREVTTTKSWAVFAHGQVCLGLAMDANHNGAKCKAYKKAISELAKAQASTDPADVVAAATMLKDSLSSMVVDLEEAKLC